MLDYTKLTDKAELLKALAHPVRLCIVAGLMGKECNVSTMQECLALPQPTVSQHLAVLKEKGIIKGVRKGAEIIYRVDDERVRGVVNELLRDI